MFVLTITNLARNIDHHPFFNIEPNTRWIYCISRNEPLLNNFKMKVESFTPERYLQYIHIEVLPFESLTENDRDNNSLERGGYQLDMFYTEGVVNRSERLLYSYNDFSPDKWDFLNWEMERMQRSDF